MHFLVPMLVLAKGAKPYIEKAFLYPGREDDPSSWLSTAFQHWFPQIPEVPLIALFDQLNSAFQE
jgi:hypothetical protein